MARKLQSLQERLKAIERELDALKTFRTTPQLEKFRRQLIGEQSFVKNQISKLQSVRQEKEREREESIVKANKNRSAKMKTAWRFWKDMQRNWSPEKSLKEIRAAWKRHRRGLETDIPDVAWRNPSP